MSTEIDTPQATGNPYVGPEAFRRGDPFYGRDRETADLLDLLIAERVVVLYSPSGAGKSSLIAAGLVRQLEAEGFEILPMIRLTHEPPPGGSLSGPPRNRYALSTLLSLEEGLPPEHQHRTAELDEMTVTEYLANWPDLDQKPGNEVLIFDQFEEVITVDPNDHAVKEEYFADIGNALRDRNLWALFAIRMDFLAELDPYSRFVPTRFANRYRLDLLGVDQALDAVILPAADRGVDFRLPAAEKLVDDLRRVRVQRAGSITEELGPTVEPVQLQVTCRQVWNRLGQDASTINSDDVEALPRGWLVEALASYYAECVDAAATTTGVSERALRDWFENDLVTPQGIRGQVLYGPRQNGAHSERAVKMLTDAHLVRAESRSGATWYELAHDRLIEPVKDDNARWREQNLSYFERLAAWWDEQHRPDQALLVGEDLVNAEKWVASNAATISPREHEFFDASRKAADQAARERRATKRTRRWLVIAVVGCVLAAGFGGWAWRAQERAAKLASDFEVSALAGQAAGAVNFDVDLGLQLAQQAAALPGGTGANADVRNALQLATDKSPVVMVLRGHGPATDAVYSDDGTVIATHHDDGSVVVWDALTGDELYQLPTPEGGLRAPSSLTFSPDGAHVAAVTANGQVAIWPATSDAGEPALTDADEGAASWRIAFSPDGSRIASAAYDQGLSIVELTGQPVPRTSVGSRQALGFDTAKSAQLTGNDIAWTPDGSHLVVADVNGTVSVWDSSTGEHLRDIYTHPTGAFTLDMSPSGATVASGSDRLVVVTDIETGEVIDRIDQERVSDISYSSDGSRLVVVDEYGGAPVIDLHSHIVRRDVRANGMSLVSVDVDPTYPGRAVVASKAGEPAVWDVSAGHTQFESAVEPLPDGGILTASYDGSVNIWAADMTYRQVVPPSDDEIRDAALSQAGDLFALARWSGAVEVWDMTTPSQLHSLAIGDTNALTVAFSSDGRYLAAGGSEGSVVVWDASTGVEISTLDSHSDGVVSVDYGLDDSQLVSASKDETAIVWDLDSSRPEHVLQLDTKATVAAWNRAGTLLAIGGEDGSVQFWDPESATKLHKDRRNEHAKAVNDIAFDSTSDRLVSGSDDRSVILWDATAGTVSHRIQQGNAPWRVTFSTDDDHVLVADGSGRQHVVYLDPNELLGVAKEQTTRDLSAAECRLYVGDAADCPAE